MATTRLVGKTQRRRARTDREQLSRKNQRFMPVIKKVTAEELKATFKAKPAAKAKKEEAPKAEEAKTEAPKKADAPKAEKKAPAKKEAAPKKED